MVVDMYIQCMLPSVASALSYYTCIILCGPAGPLHAYARNNARVAIMRRRGSAIRTRNCSGRVASSTRRPR